MKLPLEKLTSSCRGKFHFHKAKHITGITGSIPRSNRQLKPVLPCLSKNISCNSKAPRSFKRTQLVGFHRSAQYSCSSFFTYAKLTSIPKLSSALAPIKIRTGTRSFSSTASILLSGSLASLAIGFLGFSYCYIRWYFLHLVSFV